MTKLIPVIILLLLNGSPAASGTGTPVKPGPGDKCPVCGMFVAKYPDFVSQAHLRDGTVRFFDGPKDLFKFLLNRSSYVPKGTRVDVETVLVTDYYERKQINAKAAWFVIGSDIRGPMGHELVPFHNAEEAREFMKDHHGQRALRFTEVTAATLKELE